VACALATLPFARAQQQIVGQRLHLECPCPNGGAQFVEQRLGFLKHFGALVEAPTGVAMLKSNPSLDLCAIHHINRRFKLAD
jgi:hypothetical protein